MHALRSKTMLFTLISGLLFVLVGVAMLVVPASQAQSDALPPLHPTFPLLDADGNQAQESGQPVSPMTTCGTCHDTTFIAEHSLHADVGAGFDAARLIWEPGSTDSEMNCFMCHLDQPNYEARFEALAADNGAWAATATLSMGDLVAGSGADWSWNFDAFDDNGYLHPGLLTIAEPSDANCGQCHGVVQDHIENPLAFDPLADQHGMTFTTGQVYAPERIRNSGMNIADKAQQGRSWDVHAERVVNCVDCHHSLNNPVMVVEAGAGRPDHLEFEPRRLEYNEYLQRPLHVFANSDTDSAFAAAGRTCTSCHDAVSTHTWLPFAKRHTQVMACETCHVPQLHASALMFADWTTLNPDGEAVLGYRGIDSTMNPPLLTGYEPTLLRDEDGLIAPHNLVSIWYWEANGEPIPQAALEAAYFDGSAYAAEVQTTFDANQDGALDDAELLIDTDEKEALIAQRLADLGYPEAVIVGAVQEYAIHHSVTHGDWAIRDCASCHSEESRLNVAFELGNRLPSGTVPTFGEEQDDLLTGKITLNQGILFYEPHLGDDIYVLGNDSVPWIDWFGIIVLLATLAGVFLHAGLRYVAVRRLPVPEEPELREVYMYTIYERQWHWLQSAVITGLLFTGLIIHKPELFAWFSFRYTVLIHNALALIMVINAALAAFYHLASGEIRQFLPEPRGFFGKMFAQAKYYLWGIFRNDPHPFEKTPESKLNPIQQLTYFGLLNVLLPVQVITGILMWGAQEYPGLTQQLGGLAFLAPLHSLAAWLMVTFIVVHVYMTTTGHTPMANIKAMILGWDEVEVHHKTDTELEGGTD